MSEQSKQAPRPAFAPPPPEDQARIKALEEEIAGLHQQMQDCDKQSRELQGRELAGEGPFASEIFTMKQRKMMLATQIQHCKVRINHLLWGSGA